MAFYFLRLVFCCPILWLSRHIHLFSEWCKIIFHDFIIGTRGKIITYNEIGIVVVSLGVFISIWKIGRFIIFLGNHTHKIWMNVRFNCSERRKTEKNRTPKHIQIYLNWRQLNGGTVTSVTWILCANIAIYYFCRKYLFSCAFAWGKMVVRSQLM